MATTPVKQAEIITQEVKNVTGERQYENMEGWGTLLSSGLRNTNSGSPQIKLKVSHIL